MKKQQNTRQLNRREIRFLIALCFLCLCVLTFWLFLSSDGILKYRDIKKELDIMQTENENLKEENKVLQEKINQIIKNPDYFEDMARDDYKLLKKNEAVFEFR